MLGIKRHYNGQPWPTTFSGFAGQDFTGWHAWSIPARDWLVEEDKVPESSKAALKVNSFVTKDHGFTLLCCLSPPPVTFAGLCCWPMLLSPLCHPLRARSPQELQSSTAEAPAKELSQQSAASTGAMKDCVRLLVHANHANTMLQVHTISWSLERKTRKKYPIRMIVYLCPRTIRRGADLWRTFWDTYCDNGDAYLDSIWPLSCDLLICQLKAGREFEEAENKLRW